MPEKYFSRATLALHFRKFLPVYLLTIFLSVVFGVFLFSVTAPRTDSAEQVKIYIFATQYDADACDAFAQEVLEALAADHPSLKEVAIECCLYADNEQEEFDCVTLLFNVLSMGDADLFIANPNAFDRMSGMDISGDLAPYIADGTLAVDPSAEIVLSEDGKTVIALSGDCLSGMASKGCFAEGEMYVMLSGTSDNLSDTLDVLGYITSIPSRENDQQGE